MADAAQLKLQVGLDLAFFRAELGKVATAASAYYYPINLLINKKNLTTQLEAIGRNIGTKKYTIDLNDTAVVTAAGKIEKLAASLKQLSGSIQIDFNAGGGTKPIGTAMKEMAAKLAKESKGDINEAVKRMVGMRGAAPFGKGVRGIPGFSAAAKVDIESAFKLFFQELNQVNPQGLRKALDDGSVMMMQENREIKQKFDKIQSSAEGLAKDLRAMGEAAQATGKASLSDGGKTLYPQNYGLKIASLLGQIEKLDKELKRVSAASGVELLDNLKELSHVLRATSNSFVGITGFSDTLDATLKHFNTATQAAARATNAYADRIRRRGRVEYGPSSQKLLPPSPLLSLREMGENMARQYQAPKGLLPAGNKTAKEALGEAYTRELRRSFSSRNAIAGLLPPALEPSPGSYRTVRPAPAPPVVETRAELFARRTRQAYINSAARAGDERQSPLALPSGRDRVLGQPPLMTAPSIGGRQINRGVGAVGAGPVIEGRGMAPPSFQKGFGSQEALAIENAAKQELKFGLATDTAQRSLGKMNASQIPFIGGLRGVAGELGQATKQVLLYGTAYRALAAITSIPGQLLNAAKSQQQYTNGLKVATEETGTFAKELLFVDNVQRAFGLNLETTRTGFTRLYASMAPTGFDSGSIEKLFTGISAATAALQLTPDKAERVIYAFGQMASKGQIMSEELKGQLGDVLPGALAIFAKSAGMSVKEFSKAMEDGEFVGDRFREVFAKVSDELMNRFGTGAQAAGKSLQGLLSTVGGDVTRTLESFAPMANAAAQATLLPLVGMLRDVQMAAKIAMGEQDRVKKQLEDSRKDVSALKAGGASAKEIKAAEDNVAALAVQYEVLNEAAKDPAIAQQVKNIEAFVTEVQKAATFTMNLAGVIGNVLNPLITVLGGNFTSVIGNLALLVLGFNTAKLAVFLYMGAVSATTAVAGITRGGAIGATLLAGAFRLLGAQATAADAATKAFGITVRGLAISTGFGALVVLIGSIAAAFLSVGDRAKEAADRTKQSIDSMVDASRTGNVSLIKNNLAVNKAERQDVETLITKIEKLRAGGVGGTIPLTPELQREAERVLGTKPNSATRKDMLLDSLDKRRKILKEEDTKGQESLTFGLRREKLLGLNKPTPNPSEDEKDPKKKQNLESYYSLQDTLAKNAANFAAAQTEEGSNRRIELLELYYDIQETRANAYQKDAIRFEREMVMIEAKRQQARLKAELDVQRNQSSVVGGAPGAAKLPGSISGRLDASGQNGADMPVGSNNTIQSYHNGLVKALGTAGNNGNYIVIDFIDDLGNRLEATYSHIAAAVKVGQSVVGGQTIGRFDASGRTTGPHNSIDINSPGNNGLLQRGRETSAAQRSADILVAGNVQGQVSGLVKTAPAKVTGNEKRDAVATQKTLQASIAQTAINRGVDAKAAQEQIVAFEKYRAAAFPTTEQDMQNKLLAKRNELFKSGMTEERIDQEVKLYENQERGAAGLDAINRLQAKKIITDTQATLLTKELNKDIADQNNLLQQNAILIKQSKFNQAMQGLRNQIDMARALTPEQEMRTQIKQEGYVGAEAESILQERKTLQSAEKLKADLQGIASSIGDAFSSSFKGIIDGSMTAQQALAGFFQNLSNYFADMVSKMIAEYLKMQLIKGLTSLIPGLGGMFGGGGGGLSDLNAPQTINNPLGFTAANGGIATGGFRAFATGGIVTGPTLGLVGEGRYNEAVIPLPDGKSVPVDLGGEGARIGGNGDVSVGEINITVQNTGDTLSPAAQKQIAGQVQGIVLATMADQRRSGGLLR